jgi:hypothetical protein
MSAEELVLLLNEPKGFIDTAADISVPIIAFLVFLITGLQWWTNQKRLKHELFDRRYKQFEAVKTFLESLMSGKMENDVADSFIFGTKGIRFTYSKEMYEYVNNKVWGMGVDLNTLSSKMEDPAKKPILAEKHGEHMKQIIKEIRNLESKFV